MTVSSTCSPTPSMQASSRLPNDAITHLADSNNTCDRLYNESNRFDCYSNDSLAIAPNGMPSNTPKTGNLPSIDQFQCMLNRRQRGEKRPIPDEQKDEKYFERRKRNNEAAKKSRDARKIREDRVSPCYKIFQIIRLIRMKWIYTLSPIEYFYTIMTTLTDQKWLFRTKYSVSWITAKTYCNNLMLKKRFGTFFRTWNLWYFF